MPAPKCIEYYEKKRMKLAFTTTREHFCKLDDLMQEADGKTILRTGFYAAWSAIPALPIFISIQIYNAQIMGTSPQSLVLYGQSHDRIDDICERIGLAAPFAF